MPKPVFEVSSKSGKKIRLTISIWYNEILVEHLEFKRVILSLLMSGRLSKSQTMLLKAGLVNCWLSDGVRPRLKLRSTCVLFTEKYMTKALLSRLSSFRAIKGF